jgi:hypothetical protein
VEQLEADPLHSLVKAPPRAQNRLAWEMLEWEVHYLRTLYSASNTQAILSLRSILQSRNIDEIHEEAGRLYAILLVARDQFDRMQLEAMNDPDFRKVVVTHIDLDAVLETAADPDQQPAAGIYGRGSDSFSSHPVRLRRDRTRESRATATNSVDAKQDGNFTYTRTRSSDSPPGDTEREPQQPGFSVPVNSVGRGCESSR